MRCFLVLSVGVALSAAPSFASANTHETRMPRLNTFRMAQSDLTPETPLAIEPQERQYFQLGDTLARASFAYAELAQEAAKVGRKGSKLSQLRGLAKLAPLAQRNRVTAQEGFARAQEALIALEAPRTVLASISAAATRLNKPPVLSGDAQTVAIFDKDAAFTLAGLQEFERLSSLPQSPALMEWLSDSESDRSSHVWYAEGVITGLAQIAATRQMPDLLPPRNQVATDLRGLRDWLVLRLPDSPSTEQLALRKALDTFLNDSARPELAKKEISGAQLQALGNLSRALQEQILNTSRTPTTTVPPTTSPAPDATPQIHSASPLRPKLDSASA